MELCPAVLMIAMVAYGMKSIMTIMTERINRYCIMRFELNLTVSGMDAAKMAALYDFLDDNKYSYVGSETEYDEHDGKYSDMKMYERIQTMTENEMQWFIYWCYQMGWKDHSMGCEDSPGRACSFFGGGILDYDASEVEKMLDDFYNFEWRNE